MSHWSTCVLRTPVFALGSARRAHGSPPTAAYLGRIPRGDRGPAWGGPALGPRRRARYSVSHGLAPPPKTATRSKRHAGAAWPTRITCDGSPLPQNGVPITSKVEASPTAASERQKVALMPR